MSAHGSMCADFIGTGQVCERCGFTVSEHLAVFKPQYRGHHPNTGEPVGEDKPPRQTVVVDVETNGLSYSQHVPVEVAWWNLDTGSRGSFVPAHDVSAVLATADIKALRINRYLDRLADAEQDAEGLQALALAKMLRDQTLAGSNPRFDAHMLSKIMPVTWHYRLLDIGAYGAGVLRRPPEEGVPGLWDLCQHLRVSPEDDVHAAEGGVTAAGNCLLELRKIISYANMPRRVILGSAQPAEEYPVAYPAPQIITRED